MTHVELIVVGTPAVDVQILTLKRRGPICDALLRVGRISLTYTVRHLHFASAEASFHDRPRRAFRSLGLPLVLLYKHVGGRWDELGRLMHFLRHHHL